ncbi:MAG: sulfatase [Isosphaeraceae bacterium]|jgi:hypothetical protein|nr:MAG: sulfatase [Isosphaeraceae bacterium]
MIHRRGFLADLGMGFAGLALGAMLHRDGIGRTIDGQPWSPPDGSPHFPPKARSVIWLFMVGGVSHLESFDPKPELIKYSGKSYTDSPYGSILDSPYGKKNLREFLEGNHKVQPTLFAPQVGFRKRGQAGIEVSDWWPHVGECVDDLAIIRSMWTTDNDHGAQLQFHTGRHALEGPFPTIGSWIHYGLGTLNENLPQFVVLGQPIADCCGGMNGHGASYLGPEHDGVVLEVDPKQPLPFATPDRSVYREEQAAQFEFIGRLNRLAAERRPQDAALRARIQSYELAARMQLAVPEVVTFDSESAATRSLYGLDDDATRPFGQLCLAARRLVERGVRFVQVFHGSDGGAGAWDAHGALKVNHARTCAQVDRPIAGLLRDLKRRGLLEETIVVWATEFGRTPGAQGGDGRDHHPFGFSVWMAGGGIRGGVVHGATDELGHHAVEDRHYVTDIHATVLHQLGLDSRRLEVPGYKRLDLDHGRVIRPILA